jgi:uncharacterized protein (TIGR03435 family)
MRTWAPLTAVWLAANFVTTYGQEPSFDVASVKVNTSGAAISRISAPTGTGRFDATNAALRTLILNAYGIAGFQLTGGPSWIDSMRVDIAARTMATATRDEIEHMLRALLAERFHLVVRRETREMPAYALVVARDDRRLGPRLNVTATDCAAAATAARGAAPPPSTSGQLLCNTRMTPTSVNAGGMSMARLAATLTGVVGRPVTDETHLTGVYDLQLAFTPEQPLPGAPTAPDPDAPSIFTAVQEQLGLRLDATRGLVDVLVIESVEAPTPD